MTLKKVTVFCGAAAGNDPVYRQAAEKLGVLLAKNNTEIVYGAGYYGIMGILAEAAMKAKGKVTGVITTHLKQFETPQFELSSVIETPTMWERKRILFANSDAFFVLPGGLGSLDEVLEVICLRQIQEINQPTIFLNTNGFWTPLTKMIEHIIEKGFARKEHLRLFTMVDTPEEMIPTAEKELDAKERIPGWPMVEAV